MLLGGRRGGVARLNATGSGRAPAGVGPAFVALPHLNVSTSVAGHASRQAPCRTAAVPLACRQPADSAWRNAGAADYLPLGLLHWRSAFSPLASQLGATAPVAGGDRPSAAPRYALLGGLRRPAERGRPSRIRRVVSAALSCQRGYFEAATPMRQLPDLSGSATERLASSVAFIASLSYKRALAPAASAGVPTVHDDRCGRSSMPTGTDISPCAATILSEATGRSCESRRC